MFLTKAVSMALTTAFDLSPVFWFYKHTLYRTSVCNRKPGKTLHKHVNALQVRCPIVYSCCDFTLGGDRFLVVILVANYKHVDN